MSYTAGSIRDSIRIRIVTPDSIRIRFERKRPIHRSLGSPGLSTHPVLRTVGPNSTFLRMDLRLQAVGLHH